MIRKLALTGVAIAMVLGAGPALAQAQKYRVLLASPKIVAFANEPAGPPEARTVTSFIMTAEPIEGVDVTLLRWTVNCTSQMLTQDGGVAYLGTTRLRDMASETPNGPEASSSRPLFALVANYACNGERRSAENAVFPGEDAARAYGRKQFGQ